LLHLEHIQVVLANDHNVINISIVLMEQYESLLESFGLRENGVLDEKLKMRENNKVILK